MPDSACIQPRTWTAETVRQLRNGQVARGFVPRRACAQAATRDTYPERRGRAATGGRCESMNATRSLGAPRMVFGDENVGLQQAPSFAANLGSDRPREEHHASTTCLEAGDREGARKRLRATPVRARRRSPARLRREGRRPSRYY